MIVPGVPNDEPGENEDSNCDTLLILLGVWKTGNMESDMETDPKPQLQIGDVLRVLLTIIALSRLCYGYFSSAKSFFSTPNIIFHWIRILRRNVFLKLSDREY